MHDPYRKKTDCQIAGFPSIYLGPDPRRPEAHLILNKSGKMVISSNEVIFNENCQWLSFDQFAPFSALNRPPAAMSYPEQIAAIEKPFEEEQRRRRGRGPNDKTRYATDIDSSDHTARTHTATTAEPATNT